MLLLLWQIGVGQNENKAKAEQGLIKPCSAFVVNPHGKQSDFSRKIDFLTSSIAKSAGSIEKCRYRGMLSSRILQHP